MLHYGHNTKAHESLYPTRNVVYIFQIVRGGVPTDSHTLPGVSIKHYICGFNHSIILHWSSIIIGQVGDMP